MPNKSTAELRKRLDSQPYLLVDCANAKAKLADEAGTMKALGDHTYLVMNVGHSFDALTKLAKGATEFSLTDVAKVAGVDYPTAHYWMREGIIIPSIRGPGGAGRGRGPVFAFADAFAAGVIGSLRRHGLSLEIVKLIAPLFEERSAGRAVTGKRS